MCGLVINIVLVEQMGYFQDDWLICIFWGLMEVLICCFELDYFIVDGVGIKFDVCLLVGNGVLLLVLYYGCYDILMNFEWLVDVIIDLDVCLVVVSLDGCLIVYQLIVDLQLMFDLLCVLCSGMDVCILFVIVQDQQWLVIVMVLCIFLVVSICLLFWQFVLVGVFGVVVVIVLVVWLLC